MTPDDPAIRPAESGDLDRLSSIAEASMTVSYGTSPEKIDAVVESEFGTDPLAEKLDDPDVTLVVAEGEDEPVGFVEAADDSEAGSVRWIHVDPDYRGAGTGGTLFERAVAEVGDGSERVRKYVISSNAEGRGFIEHLGYEKTDEREVEIGGHNFVEYVYAESQEDRSDGSDDQSGTSEPAKQPPVDDSDLPQSVPSDDGELYLDEGSAMGTEGAFSRVYVDEDLTEQYGFYCDNCGSTDVSMDSMQRLRCPDCGNTRTADADYDDSYL